MWQIETTKVSVANGDSSNRVADEFVWKVTTFDVTDTSGNVHHDVNYISILSGTTERAVIRRVGGQLHWTINGDIPEICSRYNVTAWVPACANGGSTAGNVGIPAMLINLPDAKIKAEWKNADATTTVGDVAKVYLKPRTCPPY